MEGDKNCGGGGTRAVEVGQELWRGGQELWRVDIKCEGWTRTVEGGKKRRRVDKSRAREREVKKGHWERRAIITPSYILFGLSCRVFEVFFRRFWNMQIHAPAKRDEHFLAPTHEETEKDRNTLLATGPIYCW